MNAVTTFPDIEETELWSAAHKAVHAWRGQAIQIFSKAEAEVSKTLFALSLDAKRGAEVGLQHLVGQRFEDLTVAIAPDGAFAVEGAKASAALANFRTHDKLRAALCHGVAKVTFDQRGEWVVLMRMLVFRGRQPEHKIVAFEQREANDLLHTLGLCQQRLCSALQLLREKLDAGAATSAPPA